MIETKGQREARLKAEAADREANIRRYEAKMKVELPYSPVAVVERAVEPDHDEAVTVTGSKTYLLRNTKTVTLHPEEELRNKPKSRADYMREYRKREKKCPHCGGEL